MTKKWSRKEIKRQLGFFYALNIHPFIWKVTGPFRQAQCMHKDCEECEVLKAFTVMGGTTGEDGKWNRVDYFGWKDQVFVDGRVEREDVVLELIERFGGPDSGFHPGSSYPVVSLNDIINEINKYQKEKGDGPAK